MTTLVHRCSRPFAAILVLLLAVAGNRANSQTSTNTGATSDEQTIRSLVAQQNAGKMPAFTDNRIFVSGAYPQPMIGKDMSDDNKAAEQRMKKERLNFRSTSTIQRLEIAKAGDMAYEFGTANLSWDTPDQKHVAFESSYLRVWRKLDGQWKVDVFFARPNEEPQPK